MREILFRGRNCLDEKDWVYGNLEDRDGDYHITSWFIRPKSDNFLDCDCCMVDNETVGQFTGLTDKNGKKIFEGDIVVVRYPKGNICCVGDVQFDSGVFGVEWTATKENKSMLGGWGQRHNLRRFDDDIIDKIEVIGNIHDNPELLESE